jgi:hypothetical protein
VKLPTFDGKSKSSMIWWIRFRAFATVYKFIEAVKPVDEAHMPATEGDVLHEAIPADLSQIAARERNAVAMANFAMSFTDETAMGLIHKAISTEWPTGKASIVVALLLRKFKPEDTITRVELRQELNEISMKKNQEPAVLFEMISAVENRHKPCREALKTVTLLDGLIPVDIEGATATCCVHWCPAFAKQLKTWREAGRVTLKITAAPRVADRGAQCMMAGHTIDHEGDCYQMWDPNTVGAHESRDVIWLRWMCRQKQVQAVDVAMDPSEFVTPDSKSREGFDNDKESDTEPK